MTATIFPAGGHEYRVAERLSAVTMFHVARRMADTLIWMSDFDKIQKKNAADAADAAKKAGKLPLSVDTARNPIAFAKTLCAVSGRLSDADADFIIETCLGVVQRKQGVAWAPVRQGGQLMFADLELLDMLVIVWHVIDAHGLIDFFGDPSGDSTGGEKAQGSSGPRSRTGKTSSSAPSGAASADTKA